ncbi:transmembrane protein 182-like isoform X2 [Paramormyrops kingsleyae]|uniref:Transmembrane protein 182-like n=2 Tax=Paramormyrops kingsleyae TaxID=1676925 RepID=A0A3B3QGL6_9TELE|nr:transmembrane protein 182-like [Paramormyrops kingsleyae]
MGLRMKAKLVALIGAILGVVGVLCFLVAFTTDYWLLASDDCRPRASATGGLAARGNYSETLPVTAGPTPPPFVVHHEGFFRWCRFEGDGSTHILWAVLFTRQPAPKVCVTGYLFPLPVTVGPVPHPNYDTTAVFRGFWTVLMVLAVSMSLSGGFLLVCAVPFTSARLYRAAGILLLTSACLILTLVCLFVLWKELVADVKKYVLQERGETCPNTRLEAHYGWSFIVAVAGIPLIFISGLLFYFIGLHVQRYR